jgi:serine/threonine protein kinase
MATEIALPTGDARMRTFQQRTGDRQRPTTTGKTLALRRRGTAGKVPTQLKLEDEDEYDVAGDLPPRAMATVFGPPSSRPKLNRRSSSRRSLGSAPGTATSGPSSIGTPLSFHTARSSAAMSYFTASLEVLENRTEWLIDIAQTGKMSSTKTKPTVLANSDRWLQTVQTLKRLGLETIEDPKKLKQAYFQYVCDAMKRSDKVREAITSRVLAKGPVFSSEWMKHLDARGLLNHELDWSGRGEHVEYTSREENKIPLRSERILGHGQSAIVDCVSCRRIRLARKTIYCHRSLKKTQAISEVEHLHKLRHSHIVQVVGTYTIDRRLAILLYPVAQWSLGEFMVEISQRSRVLKTASGIDVWNSPSTQAWLGTHALTTFFGCISNAVAFIHQQNIRHMDFKPGNLLVRPTQRDSGPNPPLFASAYKVYVADFGIAKAYKSLADSETESRIPSFTRRYAAPEVVDQERRGFSSDIFSIGCVFVEMLATILSCSQYDEWNRLRMLLRNNAGSIESPSFPYHLNVNDTRQWLEETRGRHFRSSLSSPALARISTKFLDLLPKMLHPKPIHRPTGTELQIATRSLQCLQCNTGPEPFEAAEPSLR